MIDRQLVGWDIHRQLYRACPLVFAAVGLILGIILQDYFTLGVGVWFSIMAVCSLTGIFCFILSRSSGSVSKAALGIIAYSMLTCFIALGAIRSISFAQLQPNDISNFLGQQPSLATIRGVIVNGPFSGSDQQWEFAKFKHSDSSSSLYLEAHQVKTTSSWADVSGIVRMQISENLLDLQPGDHIQAHCRLDRFKPPGNPGQFNVADYMARRNVYIAASVNSREAIEVLQSRSLTTVFKRTKAKLRQLATSALADNVEANSPTKGLLEALLLGYRGNVESETYTAFQKTGLLHFISLSGLHLGILIGMVWWFCRMLGLTKPARAAVCIVVLAVFLMVVPPRPPTLRAAVMCLMLCVSNFFRRYSSPYNTLSLAAIILLLIRPTQLFEAGWQLSFACVLGIIFFTDRIEFFIKDHITNWQWSKKILKIRLLFKIVLISVSLFSVSLAAWLGSAGILLYHFYTITPLAYIWTIIVFPLIALILAIGFLKVLLAFLIPSVAALLAVATTYLCQLLIWIVKFIADFGVSQILIGNVPALLIIFYYLAIAFVAVAYFKKPIVKKIICASMFLAIIASVGTIKWQRTYRDDLLLSCLDVGHGQAVLVQLPGRANLLFDAGSLHNSNVGQRIVLPYLNYIGASQIDAVVISHEDVDHINGIPEIAADGRVKAVYANEFFFNKADKWDTAEFLQNSLSQKNILLQTLPDELNLTDKATVRTIWPDKQSHVAEHLGDNDRSTVTLIEFAQRTILICSDIEDIAQQKILELFGDIKADIVIMPHHGSIKTLDPGFLKALDPEILLVSCNQTQYERQKAEFKTYKTRSLHTAKDGAIIFSIDKNGLNQRP
ncbi:MAG: DNA internalization-related competence protein ComEC/Rec2 [Planctomycetota bacterium]|jgi:competence protein ComEC